MKGKWKLFILAALLCLLCACGENPPSLQLVLEDAEITIEGKADEITYVSLFGEVLTRETIGNASTEAVEVDVGDVPVDAALEFSCTVTELKVSKLSPEQKRSEFACGGTLSLEPGCVYNMSGTFQDGWYTYKMTFGQIIVADSEETRAIKEEIEANTVWE